MHFSGMAFFHWAFVFLVGFSVLVLRTNSQGCSAILGMENYRIKNSQITASSQWDSNHAAIQARLNFKAGGGKQGGWSARWNDHYQWIQVAVNSYTKLTGIATQGRNGHSQWVTKYKLLYSDDGRHFYYYRAAGQSWPKVFNGNYNRDRIVYHTLNPPIRARYIRLKPTAWYRHISMRMELYGCTECSVALGMENHLIIDARITASSEWDSNHAAIQARLNFKERGGKKGGWSARWNDHYQWIQVALSSYTKLTSIATQGRNGHSQWVTKYQLQYSDNGVNFHYYRAAGQSWPKVFNGNYDRDTIVYHKLNPPIQTRYIRLRPTAWFRHISLRMELYGCSGCSAILGMENYLIKNSQITASSQWDSYHAAIQARLNFKAGGAIKGGWSARWNDHSQWIQVTLGSYTKLTGIATQGRNGHSQWVTKYELQYSDNGVSFHYYRAAGQSWPKVFYGNYNRDSIVYHTLNPPIRARCIRLRPTAWFSHISMRMELYGCTECSAALGMENRLIIDARITASSEWDSNHAAIQARLNFKESGGKKGGWSARWNDHYQWIQVALSSYTKLTSIATQGRNGHSQWVTKYKLQYSDNGVNFHYYRAAGQSWPKVFNGNYDRDTIVYHKLNPPIQTRYIRLRPTAWFRHISLRMELYGCSGSQGSRGRREVSDHVTDVYSLAGKDPLNLARGKVEEKRGIALDKSALMTFKKSHDKSAGNAVLVSGDQE